MARPKEATGSLSAAFQERCTKEKMRLQQKMAKLLQADINCLLSDDQHTDLTLFVPNDQIHLHTVILKHRAPWFFEYLGDPTSSGRNLDHKNVPLLKQVISDIYQSNELQAAKAIVERWLEKGTSPEPGTDTTLCTSDSGFSDGLMIKSSEGPTLPSKPAAEDESDRSQAAQKQNGNTASDPDLSTNQTDRKTDQLILRKIDSLSSPDDFDPDLESEFASLSAPLGSQACCKLGEDLLNIYKTGESTDMTINAGGQQFHAHRCILSARSTYFSAMLGGAWKESSSQEINLEGVSSGVVEQALLYMYGGVYSIQPGCNISELVTIADMYGIQGLKDIASFVLKMDFCHFFHKPCAGCLAGVSDTIPMAMTYGITDLLDKCLKWNTKHFVKLWSSKTFALLPEEALEKCCAAAIAEITDENVIDISVECDRLMGSLPQVRWAESVIAMTTKLMDACIKHLSCHLLKVIQTPKFRSLGSTMALGLGFLEDVFGRAVLMMPASMACDTYLACQNLKQFAESEDCTWTEDFRRLIGVLFPKCEQYMNLYINQVVATDAWQKLPENMQKKLKEGAWYIVPVGDNKRLRAMPPKLSSANRPKSSKLSGRPTQISLSNKSRPSSGRKTGTPTPSPASTPTPSSEGTSPTKLHLGTRLSGYGGRTGLKSPGSKTSSQSTEAEDLTIPGGRAGLRKWKTTPLSSPDERHVQALKKLEAEIAAENSLEHGEGDNKENSSHMETKSGDRSSAGPSRKLSTEPQQGNAEPKKRMTKKSQTSKQVAASKSSSKQGVRKVSQEGNTAANKQNADSQQKKTHRAKASNLPESSDKSKRKFEARKVTGAAKKDKSISETSSGQSWSEVTGSPVKSNNKIRSHLLVPSPAKQKANMLMNVTLAQGAKMAGVTNSDDPELLSLMSSRSTLADEDDISVCSHMAVRGSISTPR